MTFTDNDYVNTFRIYIGLKQHFNPDNKYIFKGVDGLKRITVDSVLKRKDIKYFVLLTQKRHKEIYEFLLSMFLKDSNMWVGEMLTKSNYNYHVERMARIKTLHYTVTSEIEQTKLTTGLEFDKLLDDNYNIPEIAKHDRCSLETMACVNKVKCFTEHETINPLWNELRWKIDCYSKLILPSDDTLAYLEVAMKT